MSLYRAKYNIYMTGKFNDKGHFIPASEPLVIDEVTFEVGNNKEAIQKAIVMGDYLAKKHSATRLVTLKFVTLESLVKITEIKVKENQRIRRI